MPGECHKAVTTALSLLREVRAPRVMAEIDRKRRMGENLMRVAGKYGQG